MLRVYGKIESPMAYLCRVDAVERFVAEDHIWATPGYMEALTFWYDEPNVWADLIDADAAFCLEYFDHKFSI